MQPQSGCTGFVFVFFFPSYTLLKTTNVTTHIITVIIHFSTVLLRKFVATGIL